MVFGDYVSSYYIQRAVADKATVQTYYENRIAKLCRKVSIAATEVRELVVVSGKTSEQNCSAHWS